MTADDFYRTPGEEIHIQRGYKIDGRAPLVDYDDADVPDFISDLRVWLRDFNDWMEDADVACDLPDVDTTDRRLFRIFNNESFTEGGRLYRGFWQRMASADRHHIRIEGQPVVQLDYRATMLTLAYGDARADLPSGDPYLIEGLEDYRKGVKRLVSCLLCVNKPLKSWPSGVADYFRPLGPDGERQGSLVGTLPNIHKRIFEAHPKIDFESGRGLRLMWTESQILVEVLNACKRRGIVPLPVHDCVCVRKDRATEVKQLMTAWFEAYSGVPAMVTAR